MPPKKNVSVDEVVVAPVAQTQEVPKSKNTKKGQKASEDKPSTPDVPPVAPVKAIVEQTKDVANSVVNGINGVEKEEVVVDEASCGEVILKGLIDKVSLLNGQIKVIQTSLKQLVKEFDKQKKIIDKVQKKREKAKKSPSGFAKPCKISDELCDFMGIKKGSEQSRTDITRYINAYVKEHNLNNPENRREFFPDKKLKSILNIKDGEKVTYFVLQRLIAHHFPPSQSKLATVAQKV